MSERLTYTVPGMSCGHCKAAVLAEITAVEGVGEADVDMEAKLVVVRGADLDDGELRAALAQAGYEAA